jgi:hypothetical protein
MVRPASFSFNDQTAANNFFQKGSVLSNEAVLEKAVQEFDGMVDTLRKAGVNVIVAEDGADPPKPDAIFPNNWIQTTGSGEIILFPMFAPNRRPERDPDIIRKLMEKFLVHTVTDLSAHEHQDVFLEGTGSMVFDHLNKILFAAISSRTNEGLLAEYASRRGLRLVSFHAFDLSSKPVYHTNVLMSVGTGFVVLCEEAIPDQEELDQLRSVISSTKKLLIPISRRQMHSFAGNMLELKNIHGENLIVLSRTAMDSLQQTQIDDLKKHGILLTVDISLIEQVNGGSVRCMMAEVFLSPAY